MHSFTFIRTFLFLSLCFLLAGCGGGDIHEHAVTGICKSCKPYYVRGSWHHPQLHYQYDEVGLASWYGPGFHGKPKPYGELFDQHAITAAHKTLPLPTVVKVTNLESGRSIVLIIDDRGPFVYDGRILDLSMGAAKALGCYDQGIVKVRVEALPKASKALSNYLCRYGKTGRDPLGRTWWQIYKQEISGYHDDANLSVPAGSTSPLLHLAQDYLSSKPVRSAIKENSGPKKQMDQLIYGLDKNISQKKSFRISQKNAGRFGEYYIHVGGDFIQLKSADSLLKKLKPDHSACVHRKKIKGQNFYRVQIGPFKDSGMAQHIIKRLNANGLKTTLIKGD